MGFFGDLYTLADKTSSGLLPGGVSFRESYQGSAYKWLDKTSWGLLPGGSTYDESYQGQAVTAVPQVLTGVGQTIGDGLGGALGGLGEGLGKGLTDALKGLAIPLALAAGAYLLITRSGRKE